MPLLTSVLGIAGNITTIMLLLSPMPTFWAIVKKKTTGCYSAQPYLFGLFAAMMWAYYGLLQMKKSGFLVVIIINAISCTFYTLYLTCYLVFASNSQRKKTGWFLLAIVCFFTFTIISSKKFLHGSGSLMVVGLLSTIISSSSTAAPLSIMRRVIKTKSVQYMPLSLSICLFLNASTWLAYAFCIKDLYLIITNAFGVLFGAVQLGLYTFYRFYGVKSEQVVDESDLNMKVNNMENADVDAKSCSGRASRTTSNSEMELKICSGRASRTSSNVATTDFNNVIVEFSPKIHDMCGTSEQNMLNGRTLRKLPTPRSISLCDHLSL